RSVGLSYEGNGTNWTRTSIEFGNAESHAEFAMEIVRTTLGNTTDHAAGGATEFGFESAGLHLNLLQRLERNIIVGVQETVFVVLVFLTVNDEAVLWAGRAVDRKLSAEGFRANS